MKKQYSKPSITDYDFLRLLTSTIILHDENPIFENQQLQKDLYKFYDNPNYNFLFEDVSKKESIEGNNYVVLGDAFQFELYQVAAMDELVTQLYEQKNIDNHPILIKHKNTNTHL